jgi:hypothetical protein
VCVCVCVIMIVCLCACACVFVCEEVCARACLLLKNYGILREYSLQQANIFHDCTAPLACVLRLRINEVLMCKCVLVRHV